TDDVVRVAESVLVRRQYCPKSRETGVQGRNLRVKLRLKSVQPLADDLDVLSGTLNVGALLADSADALCCRGSAAHGAHRPTPPQERTQQCRTDRKRRVELLLAGLSLFTFHPLLRPPELILERLKP